MTAVLTPAPKAQFFTNNGEPLVGGKLYSYAAGTTTPLATYTTYAGNVANTNPVILDSRGEANVWLTSGVLYKLALYDADNALIWTVDNVSSINDGIFSGPVAGTTATFSGALTAASGAFSGAVSGTTGTFSGNVQMTSLNGGAIALRNKIINGSFTVNQRGITTVTPASGDYTLDRWFAVQTVAGKFSVATGAANVAAVAAGVFGSLVTITSLSTYSVGASEAYSFGQRIEGYNIADLLWGSPNAKTITLSFYVNSTLTGTFGGALKNSANTRSYPFSYSIPAANTWTRISIIITGDTTAALTDWLTTNGIGLSVIFGLGVGATLSGTAGAWAAANYSSATSAVSVVGTNGATWTLANVQFEASPVATPFEQRSIALETLLAQRYYYRLTPGVANKTLSTAPCIVLSAVSATGSTQFPVSMRATPSDLDQSGTANQYSVISVANTTCTAVPILNANLTTADFGGVTFTTTGATAGTGTLRTDATNGATAFLGWSAEL